MAVYGIGQTQTHFRHCMEFCRTVLFQNVSDNFMFLVLGEPQIRWYLGWLNWHVSFCITITMYLCVYI